MTLMLFSWPLPHVRLLWQFKPEERWGDSSTALAPAHSQGSSPSGLMRETRAWALQSEKSGFKCWKVSLAILLSSSYLTKPNSNSLENNSGKWHLLSWWSYWCNEVTHVKYQAQGVDPIWHFPLVNQPIERWRGQGQDQAPALSDFWWVTSKTLQFFYGRRNFLVGFLMVRHTRTPNFGVSLCIHCCKDQSKISLGCHCEFDRAMDWLAGSVWTFPLKDYTYSCPKTLFLCHLLKSYTTPEICWENWPMAWLRGF